MSPGEIAIATEMKRNNVDRLLGKMAKAGEIVKAGRGRYIHPDRTDLLTDAGDSETPGKIGKKIRTAEADPSIINETLVDQGVATPDPTDAPDTDETNLSVLSDLSGDEAALVLDDATKNAIGGIMKSVSVRALVAARLGGPKIFRIRPGEALPKPT